MKFRPQKKNANSHTDRGSKMLSSILKDDGFIGAITTAADGEVFDGSLRLETALPLLGHDPIIVRSDGTRAIIHIREDIPTAEDAKAVRLSVGANRVAEVSLNWVDEVLEEWDETVGLDQFWDDGEKPWETEEEPSFDPGAEAPDSSAQEIDVDAYEFDCKCPKCGFEFIQQK